MSIPTLWESNRRVGMRDDHVSRRALAAATVGTDSPSPRADSDDEEEDEDGKPLLKGADRDHVLGVYLIGRGQGMRAAPIDIKTGEFITNGALRPITGRSITEVAEVNP